MDGMYPVRAHDVWTSKDSGSDYAVSSIGIHTETGEETVAFIAYNDICYYMPLEQFIQKHQLTHRVYREI